MDKILNLWVYTPGSRRTPPPRSVYFKNIYVIYGYRDWFYNIKSKKIISVKVAHEVATNSHDYGLHLEKAQNLVDHFDKFLVAAIGTCDRRTKTYKGFKKKEAAFAAEVMKEILTGEK